MRIEDAAHAAGVPLVWKPFLLGPIFAGQGAPGPPFTLYRIRGRYMGRALERVCARHGLPFHRPTRFPRSGLLAARVTLIGADGPWGPEFVRGIYRANFVDDRDITAPETVRGVLSGIGVDPEPVLAAAQTPDNKDRLKRQTEEAIALGIFGAPSFVSCGELFWGNDRLDDALAWHRAAG